jgi:GntR family transcriptional regulator / MocR family aminotransferase
LSLPNSGGARCCVYRSETDANAVCGPFLEPLFVELKEPLCSSRGEPVIQLSLLLEGRKHLSDQLYHGIRRAILDGRLGVDERVPASRELARQLNVSRNTVLAAYGRLLSEGYLNSSIGSGTYVAQHFPSREQRLHTTPLNGSPRLSAFGSRLTPPQAIVPRRDLPFDFRPGVPDLRMFPMAAWRRICARQSKHLSASTAYYGDVAGIAVLRTAIARHFSHTRALHCTADDVVIVSGTQQALDIVARILIEPNDVVAVEDPGYPGAIAAFRALGAQIVPVLVDGEGICTEQLPKNAKALYVTPSHQFPLGYHLSLRRRRALLDWAVRARAVIIEDDYDSEFRYGGRPLDSLQGLDTTGSVVYLGTFSKVLFPSLRLGFLVPPQSLRSPILSAKWLTDRHTEISEQHVIASFIAEGHFGRHIRRMQRIYYDRQVTLLRALARWMPFLQPVRSVAGLHLAGFLPPIIPVDEIISRAAATGVGLYALAPFYQTHARTGLMFGFGSCTVDDISEGIRRVGNVCKAMGLVKDGAFQSDLSNSYTHVTGSSRSTGRDAAAGFSQSSLLCEPTQPGGSHEQATVDPLVEPFKSFNGRVPSKPRAFPPK